MAATTKPGGHTPPKTAEAPKKAPPKPDKAGKAPETPAVHPFVAEATAVWDRLDERERTARSLNCLVHGHPAGIVLDTGGSGVFCPHCCTWLAEPGS